MLPRVTAWTGVVPLLSFVDIRCAAYIMPIGFTVASQDVDKSGAVTPHAERPSAGCAPAIVSRDSGQGYCRRNKVRAECTFPKIQVRRNSESAFSPLHCFRSFGETAFAQEGSLACRRALRADLAEARA